MKKAFTLVELAVVILIIGILAGVILRNIGSQPIQARDTKRLAVLRNVSIYLTQYFSKNGYYVPGSYTQEDQSKLVDNLVGAGVLPPGSNNLGFPEPTNFVYFSCSDSNEFDPNSQPNHFVIQITMEQSQDQAPEIYRDSQLVPDDWSCVGATYDCDPAKKHYCLVQ